MKKIVSIALFGERHAEYAKYLPAFVRGHLNLFPLVEGWRLRVHVDDVVLHGEHGRYLARLFNTGLVDVASMGAAPLTRAMLWRMAPAFEEGVDFAFCRDIDAPPMPRDRACCDEFIRVAVEKKCSLHTIHDNVMHEGIMGGLCGVYAPLFRDVTGLPSLERLYAAAEATLGRAVPWEEHGQDQLALNRLFLRVGGPRLFEHRFNGWHAGPRAQRPRSVGKYPCGGVSSPVPDVGSSTGKLDHQPWRRDVADKLGNHLGCAGYDLVEAIRFWDVHGDAGIATTLAACEAR
jgi:hypothetical protein